jgi:uncharacterized protein DUF6335
MAKRKARGGVKKAKGARKARKASRKMAPKKRAARRATASRRKSAPKAARARRKPVSRPTVAATPPKAPRLDRARRTLDDESVPTPPSSLNMNRRGSAARTGRAEIAEHRQDHIGMTPAITGGDVDVNIEQAYFTGDEVPGGDNPTPDQDIVDDIGRAIGVEYQDNEELRASDKVAARDKHRWELDPASAEDYKDRK